MTVISLLGSEAYSTKAAETFSDMGITNYLHHKMGFHDFFYGPDGVFPKYTGLPPQAPTKNRISRSADPRRIAQFNDLNISMNLPNGWLRLDPQKNGSTARVLMKRTNPTVYVSLSGYRTPKGQKSSTGAVLSASQAKITDMSHGTIHSEKQRATNGISGVAYQASATAPDGKSTIYYSVWVASYKGCNYTLSVFGDQKYESTVNSTARTALNRLVPLQPTPVTLFPTVYRR